MIKVSIGIVTYNNADKIEKLLESVYAYTTGVSFEIYIVDNNSSDRTIEIVKNKYPDVIIINMDKNLGFGAGHNQLLKKVESDYHLILNPDIRLSEDTISILAEYLENNIDVAMVTPKILNEDGTEQHLPKKKPQFKYMLAGRLADKSKHFSKIRDKYTRKNEDLSQTTEIDFATGCFLLLRTEVFRKIEGFDDMFFMYLEDADLTLRVKKSGKVVFNPHTYVVHSWERTSAKSLKYLFIHISSMRKFMKKWKKKELREFEV